MCAWGRFAAAVNALSLARNPQNLQFERFVDLYMAIDACYKPTMLLRPRAGSARSHNKRIEWLCKQFCMIVPAWADPAIPVDPAVPDRSEVSMIRNAAFHEASFMEAPLGFAIHICSRNTKNLMLEMTALVCRLLVALICGDDNTYVRSPTNTCIGLRISSVGREIIGVFSSDYLRMEFPFGSQ